MRKSQQLVSAEDDVKNEDEVEVLDMDGYDDDDAEGEVEGKEEN